jgi:sugar/nucleoside kinase (ribokinase family)
VEDNVIFKPHPELDDSLECIDILVLSLADVAGDRTAADHILTSVKIGVETLGQQGCRVYHNGEVVHIPVRTEEEVDPTGAGDIFAAAFFVRYRDTGDIVKAAQFANACGSLSVGKIGLASVPTLPQVEAQLVELYGEQALPVS